MKRPRLKKGKPVPKVLAVVVSTHKDPAPSSEDLARVRAQLLGIQTHPHHCLLAPKKGVFSESVCPQCPVSGQCREASVALSDLESRYLSRCP